MKEILDFALQLAKFEVYSATLEVSAQRFIDLEKSLSESNSAITVNVLTKQESITPAFSVRAYNVYIVVKCYSALRV